MDQFPKGVQNIFSFPLIEALFGRRSRRFSLGASIPDGPLKFKSKHAAVPLSELEQMILLVAAAGNSGWHNMIPYSTKTDPHMPNYSNGAGGRTFPSAAGWQTSEIFYTDDHGVYFFSTRDAPALLHGTLSDESALKSYLEAHRKRIRKISDKRLDLPPKEPYITAHNHWSMNTPGSTIIIPVADLAQHFLSLLCWTVTNGYCLYDDINNRPIPGLERFGHFVDVKNPWPMTFVEQFAMTETSAELATSCYAGMLMLQALGLGGWMHDGMNKLAVLGAFKEEGVQGLGFDCERDPRWSMPNSLGLPGVFETFCPPYYPTMRAALDALIERKFGKGGPMNAKTEGPWKDSKHVRGDAAAYTVEFKECVALIAQYIYDTFGKIPPTAPTSLIATYLQAHHLDLDFYDHYYKPGAYLHTHKEHMREWH